MTRTRRRALILLFFVLMDRTAILAHIDPPGEIHPTVFAEEERFVVYFSVNRSIGADNSTSEYRREFNTSGKQLKWARRSPKPEDSALIDAAARRRSDGAKQYQLDSSARSVAVSEHGKEPARHELEWPCGRPPFEFFHDYAVTGGRLFILGYPESPKQQAVKKILTLYTFETDHFRFVEAPNLGEVAAIYHRPTASPLIPVGGLLAFAWMGSPEGTSQSQLSLTVVDPRHRTTRTSPIDAPFRWNTSISAAAIGNRICIAWHDGEAYGKVKKGKILTHFQTIGSTP